jgi:C4-dicarboxylate-specific signal transduction histidine kinase
LNSLYWVDIAARQNPDGFAGRISITVDNPFVTVEDNGPGVDPSIEAVIWEAFTSRKPRGVGRGLGLFVTQQLLQSEKISVSLDPERNERGNRYRFRLDFSQPLEGS